MKSVKRVAFTTALTTALAVGASIVTLSAIGSAAPLRPTEVVVTQAQDDEFSGGHVFYNDDHKLYIDAGCKADIVAAGIPIRLGSLDEVQARSYFPVAERASCAEVIDDLTSPQNGAGPSSLVLYVTPNTAKPDAGGTVVVDQETWTYIDSDCKASLLAAGIATQPAVWDDVRPFQQDRARTCWDLQQLLAESTTPVPTSTPPVAAPPTPPVTTPPVAAPPTPAPPAPPVTAPPVTTPAPVVTQPAANQGWVTVADESDTRFRGGRTSESYHFFDPDNHSDPTWGRSRIGWLVECESVKFEKIDPMVSPGKESHHLHEFFGNGNIDADSGTQDFADTPRGQIDCTDVNDKSAYWSPAAYQNGQRLTAGLFKAYYKSTTTDVVAMPLGLRMIAGNAAATGNQNRVVGWFEEQRTSDLTPREDLTNTIGRTKMITRQNEEVNLVLRMNFPNCWDGVHLDSPDHQSHVAYFDEASLSCPSTHPVKIPQLTTFTQYDTDGGADFSLASGEWFTFHQDFWNAWSPDQMSELTERCIQAEMNCRTRGSNALKNLGQYEEYVPAAS